MEYDENLCAGCGDAECDGECPAYYELLAKTLEDEKKGIYLPSYCSATNKKFCTICGVDWPDDTPICKECYVKTL